MEPEPPRRLTAKDKAILRRAIASAIENEQEFISCYWLPIRERYMNLPVVNERRRFIAAMRRVCKKL